MEKKTRKPKVDYGEEFIQDAVNLVYSTSKSKAQIARELGISYGTLIRWLNNSTKPPVADVDETDINALIAQNKKLKIELREMAIEREILKRFTVFWVKETQGK